MTPSYIAAGIEPLLFYLAIVAVWGVLKKIADKSQKKTPTDGEAETEAAPPKDMEEGLREFIETVTGQKLPGAGETKPTPPPPPVMRRRRPIPVTEPAVAVEPTLHRPRPEPPKPTPTPALAPQHYVDLHTPGTVDVKASEIADFIHDDLQLSLGKLTLLTRMPSLRMSMPSLKLATAKDESRPRFRAKLTSRKDVRRAIVHRVVLGPPRAMGSDYDENQLSL